MRRILLLVLLLLTPAATRAQEVPLVAALSRNDIEVTTGFTGASLVVFVAANVTLLQAVQLGTVDILLTMLLLVGGVAGAQFGAAMGTRLKGEETRALLGLLVLGVALSLLWGLLRPPGNLFSAGPAL